MRTQRFDKNTAVSKNTTAKHFSFIFHKKQFFILQQTATSELNVYLNVRNAHTDTLRINFYDTNLQM